MNRRNFTLGGLAGLAAVGMPEWAMSAAAKKDLFEQFRALPKAVWAFRQSVTVKTLPLLAQQCRELGMQSIWISFGDDMRSTLKNSRDPAWRIFRDLYSSGYDLYALTGEAAWCKRPNDIPRVVSEIVSMPGFQKYFSGMHFDVEPHTLSEWKDPKQNQDLVEGYLKFFSNMRQIIPRNQKINADITHHYPKFTGKDKTRDMVSRLSEKVDGMTLMTYVRPHDKAVKYADAVIKKGMPWRLGIHCEDFEGPDASYADNSRDQFLANMIECHNDIKGKSLPGFQGLAFYEMSGLRKILKLA